MKVSCYLFVNSVGSVRITKMRTAPKSDEVVIGLDVQLPDALFKKPHLSAVLTIPEEAAIPAELPVDVVANVHEAIRAASGMEVKLSIVGSSEQEAE